MQTPLNIHQVLKQYWGYEQFRPLQQDIIEAVLAGNDTLALLPTGGGKSICYQVPALCKEGMCIVVSPLIALMKDQVEQLQKREIPAAALYSGLSHKEQELIIENAVNGAYKFLYVSPERLQTTSFKERLPYFTVNLLAVDEAHCISQWGYDFRPEYIQIAQVRQWLKNAPVLAVTASATAEVVDDIQQKLDFKKSLVFKKSFTRTNLSYVVNKTEDKHTRILYLLQKVNGSGLIYVRNRRQTQDLASWLAKNGISADFYHAGLTAQERNTKQEKWIQNHIRIMVCTNAFGMGIDKPDVRLVIHFEIPDSPESYYQEAGRAGRDEKRAYCVLLYHQADAAEAEHKLTLNFPPNEVIKRVYQALCNYYSLPVGAIPDRSFDFDLADFVQRFSLDVHSVYPALKILSQCNLIALNETFFESAKFKFLVNHGTLYKFQVEHEAYDEFIKLLLRSYGGLFDRYALINEKQIAQRYKSTEAKIKQLFQQLNKLGIGDYQPQKDKPQLTFLTQRIAAEHIDLKQGLIEQRKKTLTEKLSKIIAYAENTNICRSRVLVSCFNEINESDCGVCDICIANKKSNLNKQQTEEIIQKIKAELQEKPMSVKELTAKLNHIKPEILAEVIRYLLDNHKLQLNKSQQLHWV